MATEIPVTITGFASTDEKDKHGKKRVQEVEDYLISMIKELADANKMQMEAEKFVKVKIGGETAEFGDDLKDNRRVTVSYEAPSK